MYNKWSIIGSCDDHVMYMTEQSGCGRCISGAFSSKSCDISMSTNGTEDESHPLQVAASAAATITGETPFSCGVSTYKIMVVWTGSSQCSSNYHW